MLDLETYLAIIDEGRAEQTKRLILDLALTRLGPLKEALLARLNGMSDLSRLERMHHRILKASSWQDLLDTP